MRGKTQIRSIFKTFKQRDGGGAGWRWGCSKTDLKFEADIYLGVLGTRFITAVKICVLGLWNSFASPNSGSVYLSSSSNKRPADRIMFSYLAFVKCAS